MQIGGTGAGSARAASIVGVTPKLYPTNEAASAGLLAGEYDVFTATGNAPIPTAQVQMRMLAPGNQSDYAMESITSLFRRPLVAGEVTTPYEFLPGNQTNVPLLATNAAAAGDAQMQAAYMAAFNRVYAAGTWSAILGGDALLAPCDACIGPASSYPFPTSPVGVLADILASGVVRMGFNTNLFATSPSLNITLINSGPNPPPGGAFYTLTNAIIAAIGAQYNKALTVAYSGYQFTDNMLDDLMAGKLDMAPATLALGATYRGIGRGFRVDPSPCFSVGGYTPIWVAASATYTNASQLMAALMGNASLMVATSGPTNYITAARYILHAALGVTFGTPGAAFDALIANASAAGPLVAVWDYSPSAAQAPYVRRLNSLSARAMSAVFRPATLPTPTPVPTPTPTPSPPMAELAQGGAVAGLAVSTVILAAAMSCFGVAYCRSAKRDSARRMSTQAWGGTRDGSVAGTSVPGGGATAPPATGGVALNPLNKAVA